MRRRGTKGFRVIFQGTVADVTVRTGCREQSSGPDGIAVAGREPLLPRFGPGRFV
jgi:hypothetical protein